MTSKDKLRNGGYNFVECTVPKDKLESFTDVSAIVEPNSDIGITVVDCANAQFIERRGRGPGFGEFLVRKGFDPLVTYCRVLSGGSLQTQLDIAYREGTETVDSLDARCVKCVEI